ncbi:MAG TPA: hypothetical protein VGV93_07390 [Acidimicrobiales bacterium]|nr:hypothetical protein [Acidimicrobiales bacterium]
MWLLGAFRPLIGAVFGAATFLVVAGGLLDVVPDSVEASPTTELLFFAALGFLAGFNERFPPVSCPTPPPGPARGSTPPEGRQPLPPGSAPTG